MEEQSQQTVKSPDPLADFVDGFDLDLDTAVSPSQQAGMVAPDEGLASDSDGRHSEVNGGGACLDGTPAPSRDCSFPEYVKQFKEAFIRAKPLETVSELASGMRFSDWMEMAIKLLPRDVKIQGDFSFVHQLEALGPVNKAEYMLPEPQAVEAEFEDVHTD